MHDKNYKSAMGKVSAPQTWRESTLAAMQAARKKPKLLVFAQKRALPLAAAACLVLLAPFALQSLRAGESQAPMLLQSKGAPKSSAALDMARLETSVAEQEAGGMALSFGAVQSVVRAESDWLTQNPTRDLPQEQLPTAVLQFGKSIYRSSLYQTIGERALNLDDTLQDGFLDTQIAWDETAAFAFAEGEEYTYSIDGAKMWILPKDEIVCATPAQLIDFAGGFYKNLRASVPAILHPATQTMRTYDRNKQPQVSVVYFEKSSGSIQQQLADYTFSAMTIGYDAQTKTLLGYEFLLDGENGKHVPLCTLAQAQAVLAAGGATRADGEVGGYPLDTLTVLHYEIVYRYERETHLWQPFYQFTVKGDMPLDTYFSDGKAEDYQAIAYLYVDARA